ncbi:ExeA family protein [Thiosulfativibrio zosterae]|uniref:AAA+ ATPase domain-containing protein n=1 Tax=Thiosulfativibrio zosterae TaxID=2675053 RepID=A0A6F8PPW4_9GAMM|nr:AAA family ATPase [Thiosulfativibrio zosterae]BBP44078.1 hypothetical protein THMIRHAT_18240 [Thiosulfativibrio zosterae]
MYKSFFGLKESPFKITPDLEYFYRQSSRDASLESLKYAIDQGEGIIKVVGEVGAGKTTLLKLLLSSLPDRFLTITLPSPTLSPKEFLLFICQSLSVKVSNDDFKHQLLKAIHENLKQLSLSGTKLILLVDEAQSCSLDLLEEIRLLSNFETDKNKLLQIILFGQTELDITLESLEAKPLKARISSSIHLEPFTAKEIQQYLNYRMRVAGYSGEDLFGYSLCKEIAHLTLGLPRAVNILADKLLLLAYSKNTHHLSKKLLRQLPGNYNHSSHVFLSIKALFGVLLIVVLGLFLVINSTSYLQKLDLNLDYFDRKTLMEDAKTEVIDYDIDKVVSTVNDSVSPKPQEAIQDELPQVEAPVLVEIDQNKDVKESSKDEEAFINFQKSTQNIYESLPKVFYTLVVMKGKRNDLIQPFMAFNAKLTAEQKARLFTFCKDNYCIIFYGYSNSPQILMDSASSLVSYDGKPFKVIRLSEVNAIIP